MDEQPHGRAPYDPLPTKKCDPGPAFPNSQLSNRKWLKEALPPSHQMGIPQTPGEPCRTCNDEQLEALMTISDQGKCFPSPLGLRSPFTTQTHQWLRVPAKVLLPQKAPTWTMLSSDGPETPLPSPETSGNLLVPATEIPPQKALNLVSTLHSLQSRETLSQVPGPGRTLHHVFQRFPSLTRSTKCRILGKLLQTP